MQTFNRVGRSDTSLRSSFILRSMLVALLCTSTFANIAFSANLTFGIAAKSRDDPNFIDAWQSCQTAALVDGNHCVLIGSVGAAHPRSQYEALKQALASGQLDAVAISVMKSDLIAPLLEKSSIPAITFDSPFSQPFEHLSNAYVGVDNLQVGRDLAKVAKQLRPRGGILCLMTASHDTNLAARIEGIRRELTSNENWPKNTPLSQSAGWHEANRCPWNTSDNIARALDELSTTLGEIKPDVIISVGHWPIIDAERYRTHIKPYEQSILDKQPIIIAATGKITPDIHRLLDDKILHGVVSLSFTEMGKLSYQTMLKLVSGEKVSPFILVDNLTQLSN